MVLVAVAPFVIAGAQHEEAWADRAYRLDPFLASSASRGIDVEEARNLLRTGKAALVAEQVDTSTPAGRMALNIMATISQWERETIGERTRMAMVHKASRGERGSRYLPYGQRLHDDGVHLVADTGEVATITRACEVREEGMSLARVASALARGGRLSRASTPFAARTRVVFVAASLDGGATFASTTRSTFDECIRAPVAHGACAELRQ